MLNRKTQINDAIARLEAFVKDAIAETEGLKITQVKLGECYDNTVIGTASEDGKVWYSFDIHSRNGVLVKKLD